MCLCREGCLCILKEEFHHLKKKNTLKSTGYTRQRWGKVTRMWDLPPPFLILPHLTSEGHFLSLPPIGSPSLPAGLPTCQHPLRVRGWETSSPGNRCQVGPELLQAGWAPPTQQKQGTPPCPRECRPSPPPTQNHAGNLAHLWGCWDINRTPSLVKTCAKFQLT